MSKKKSSIKFASLRVGDIFRIGEKDHGDGEGNTMFCKVKLIGSEVNCFGLYGKLRGKAMWLKSTCQVVRFKLIQKTKFPAKE